MGTIRRSLRAIALLSVLTLILAACGSGAGPTTTSGQDTSSTVVPTTSLPTGERKVLTIAHSREIQTLNPLFATDGDSQNAIGLIYDTLVWQSPDQEIHPRIASEWSASDDNTAFTFKINADAQWSDGTPITSADIQSTISISSHPDVPVTSGTPQRALLVGTDDAGKSLDPSRPLEGIEIVDDKTFVLHTKIPIEIGLILQGLGANTYGFYILPAHVIDEIPPADFRTSDIGTNPTVTSGPFLFSGWSQGEYAEFSKNPDYFLGEPRLDTVMLRQLPETSFLAELRTGGIDTTGGASVNTDPPASDWDSIAALNDVVQNPVPGNSMDQIMINTTSAPFDNEDVRLALTLAIDRGLLIEQVMRGLAKPALTPVHPSSRFFDSSLVAHPHDPARARTLLENANFPFDETFVLLISADRPSIEASSTIIQQMWAAVGVKVEIQVGDYPNQQERCLRQQEVDLCMFPTSFAIGIGDPDQWSHWFTCGSANNWAHLCDDQLDQAFADGRSPDTAVRIEAYHRLQQRFLEVVPHIPLYYRDILNAHSTRVNEYVPATVLGAQQPWLWDVEG